MTAVTAVRLKLLVAYDGSAFCGWQSQSGGGSVQDRLEAVISEIAGQKVIVHGAGRTDAGVHALGQCCHIDLPNQRLGPGGWLRALNGNLPPELRVLSARPTAKNFHARFSAKAKIYRYRIACGPILRPLEVGRAWHVPRGPDLPSLRKMAAHFVGTHDFAAFSANRGSQPQSTLRTLRKISVTQVGDIRSITFCGDGFLYKMVRMLTAALVRAALGLEESSRLVDRLHKGEPRWTHVAPACGLTLMRVLYSPRPPSRHDPHGKGVRR